MSPAGVGTLKRNGDARHVFETTPGCRITGSGNLVEILSLGDQPLANSLKDRPSDRETRIPLTLCYSPDSTLVQLRETVDKEVLFSNYVWVSGTAAATRAYAQVFARRTAKAAGLAPDDLVVEIASNDGTFLKPFIEAGYANVLGVDPAANIAAMAERDGVRTLARFWDRSAAEEVASRHGRAKVVFARNVIPHVSRLHDVMAGIAHLLADDGIGIIEFHYAGKILDELQYDSIYHEHLCYFSVASLEALLGKHGLHSFHADTSPISGGSVVLYFSGRGRPESAALTGLRRSESERGVNTLAAWRNFAEACRRHRQKTLDILSTFAGRTVVGFGASARSSTYINFCGIDAGHLRAVIDNAPLKRGKFTPGSSLPIVSFEEGMGMNPDLVFVFAWNFRDEIVRKCLEAGYRGKFLTAFPADLKVT